MKNAMLIGAILVFIIAVIVWATRKNSVDAEDTNYGSKFTDKIDGRCPAGTSEITSGGHKGRCYKGGSSSRRSSSRGSSSRRSSSRGSSSRGSSGSTNYGSKFVGKTNGRCPAGTVEITAGGRRGQCSSKKAVKYWGWGPNQGKKCKNPDNTGCDDKYGYTKPRSVDFKYWGWGANQGKKCRNPDNTGCDNSYAYTRAKPADPFPYWGWGPNAGMKCKNPNNTGCDTTFGYAKK